MAKGASFHRVKVTNNVTNRTEFVSFVPSATLAGLLRLSAHFPSSTPFISTHLLALFAPNHPLPPSAATFQALCRPLKRLIRPVGASSPITPMAAK